MKRASVLLMAVLFAIGLSGCGGGTTTWSGAVTTVQPRLCVGRHAALGECFVDTTPSMLSRVHVGECVTVTFTPADSPGAGPAHLRTIEPADAAAHRADCPAN